MENGLRPGKKHQHHTALVPRLHGLFLSSPLHYPRQGYRVTIMNPFRGKAHLSRAPSQALIPALTFCPSCIFLTPYFQPLSVHFCLEKTSNELHTGSSGNATSQPTSASSNLPDNDALFQGPLQTDEGMKGCFLMQRATRPKGIRHAKHKHNIKPRTEMPNNRLVNRFA